MFVTIVSSHTFVPCLVSVDKNIKKYGSFMIFVILSFFNRGVLCQDIGKLS